MALLRLKLTAEANKDFAEAARIDPDGIFGLLSRGTLSCDKKDAAPAISAFSEVIRRHPRWSGAYLARAVCYHWLHEDNEAVQDLTKAIGAVSHTQLHANAYLYLLRSEALAATGKTDEALKDLDTALQLDSHLAADVYNDRGDIYAQRREWLQAASAWARWTALNPNVAYGFKRQGDALDNAGRSQEAITAYTKAIGLETNSNVLAADYVDRAAAFSNLGEWQNTVGDYGEAIRLAPTGKAYRRRGTALILSGGGKLSDAIADLRRANELDPEDSYAILWLAIAEAKLGQLDIDELKRLVKALDPRWPRDIIRVLLNEPASGLPQGMEVLSELETQGRKCELEFYTGALRLAQGDRDEGVRRLKAAIESGAKEYIEYQAAKVELKRLGIAVSDSPE